MRYCRLVAVLVLAALLPACEQGPAGSGPGSSLASDAVQTTSDIPITRVVLYRSGIAYVERHGELDADRLSLQIRPDQINDILTTLTVIVDRGDNVASSINLPIERTIARELDQLPPQVREQGGMLSLLTAFRGAYAQVRTATDRASGRIVGTEILPNDEGNQIRRVTLLTDQGVMRQFRVDEIEEVHLDNNALEIGLEKSLDMSLGEGDWKPVELSIRLSGEAPHDIFMSYVVAMPTWKPTYRIIVEEDNLHLQSWAAVDNVSGEDWNDVSLSLVAGTPISFRYDLHSPHFVDRPDLTSRGFEELAQMAPTVDSGVRARREASRAPTGAAGVMLEARAAAEDYAPGYYGAADSAMPAPPLSPEPYENERITGEMMVNSLATNVSTEAVGSLFRYDIAYPLSVIDRGSALVAILNQPIEGEDVLYFDPASPSPQASTTPYRAIRMVNATSSTIERGPLSIYKDGTFVGQAIIPRVAESEMIFMPYSLDGRFRLTERQSTGEEAVQLVRIVNSIIYSEVQSIRSRTYQITNNSGEAARLYIRIPKATNWNLRTPDPATSGVIDQGAVWYVPVDLVAEEASREFTVEEVTTVTRDVNIWSNLAVDTIGLYISNPDADPTLAAQLQEVLTQRARIAEIQIELTSQRTRRDDVYRRMAEVRQNLEVLGETRQSQQLRRELATRLGELEEQASALTVQIISLEEEESELRARISTALMDMNLNLNRPTP